MLRTIFCVYNICYLLHGYCNATYNILRVFYFADFVRAYSIANTMVEHWFTGVALRGCGYIECRLMLDQWTLAPCPHDSTQQTFPCLCIIMRVV